MAAEWRGIKIQIQIDIGWAVTLSQPSPGTRQLTLLLPVHRPSNVDTVSLSQVHSYRRGQQPYCPVADL